MAKLLVVSAPMAWVCFSFLFAVRCQSSSESYEDKYYSTPKTNADEQLKKDSDDQSNENEGTSVWYDEADSSKKYADEDDIEKQLGEEEDYEKRFGEEDDTEKPFGEEDDFRQENGTDKQFGEEDDIEKQLGEEDVTEKQLGEEDDFGEEDGINEQFGEEDDTEKRFGEEDDIEKEFGVEDDIYKEYYDETTENDKDFEEPPKENGPEISSTEGSTYPQYSTTSQEMDVTDDFSEDNDDQKEDREKGTGVQNQGKESVEITDSPPIGGEEKNVGYNDWTQWMNPMNFVPSYPGFQQNTPGQSPPLQDPVRGQPDYSNSWNPTKWLEYGRNYPYYPFKTLVRPSEQPPQGGNSEKQVY